MHRPTLLATAGVAMATVLATAAPGVTGAAAAFAPLRQYEGTWEVQRKDAPGKPDKLVNQCVVQGKYFTCSQVVNGAQQGLVVFIAAADAGHFYAQTILPDGRNTGRTDLRIDGSTWTYSDRRSENGKPTYYRTLNVFSGKTHIHFESSHSENNKDWTVDAAGDETRVGPAAQ